MTDVTTVPEAWDKKVGGIVVTRRTELNGVDSLPMSGVDVHRTFMTSCPRRTSNMPLSCPSPCVTSLSSLRESSFRVGTEARRGARHEGRSLRKEMGKGRQRRDGSQDYRPSLQGKFPFDEG